jgi:uncharacterized membrane protein
MTRWGYLALALVGLTFGAAYWADTHAAQIPGDKIPIHWGIDGQPNGWVAKGDTFVAFYLMPLIVTGTVVLGLFALPWLSPRNFAVDTFRRTYDYVFFLIAALFAFLNAMVLLSQFQGATNMDRWLLAGICLFLAAIGNVMGKVKRNFWMGVRTPWTLADPVVWDRTHRMAAWMMVTAGVTGAVAAAVGIHFAACFAILMLGALSPLVYSLVLYKRLEREGKLEAQQQQAVGRIADCN